MMIYSAEKEDLLVVDDTPANLQLLNSILSDQGYKVRPVTNGKMAITVARSVKPALILLDINMPGMTGYEVCERLKMDPLTSGIPVIFISALNEVFDIVRAFQAGGVDYISKPFEVEEVLARVANQLTLCRLRRQLEQANEDLESQVRARTADLEKTVQLLTQQIDERRNAEKASEALQNQLYQSQKMEALGLLAGGVAHDFNNLLNLIIGYSELILEEEEEIEGKQPRPELLEIAKAGERAASLTRPLLAFTNKQTPEPVLLNIDDVVNNMQGMLQRLIGENIQLKTQISGKSGDILCDRGQLEQVIMNLVVNARDAMAEGGQLTIVTGQCMLSAAQAAESKHFKPDSQFALLKVADTGCGMDEDMLAKIFEPFFTTKAKGRGTGLGLSTVNGIVRQAGGFIRVISEKGGGTEFQVFFPRHRQPTKPPKQLARSKVAVGTGQTVLLVEDDGHVRRLIARMLRKSAYEVLEAANGAEALLLMERNNYEVQLLLTDVIMPGMSGSELARKLLRTHPKLKLLSISGYLSDVLERYGIDHQAFLQKPFTRAELLRKVNEILEKPSGT